MPRCEAWGMEWIGMELENLSYVLKKLCSIGPHLGYQSNRDETSRFKSGQSASQAVDRVERRFHLTSYQRHKSPNSPLEFQMPQRTVAPRLKQMSCAGLVTWPIRLKEQQALAVIIMGK